MQFLHPSYPDPVTVPGAVCHYPQLRLGPHLLVIGSEDTADEAISLDWSNYKSQQAAVNPCLVTAKRYGLVNYSDLDMSLQHVIGLELLSECYSYVDLPCCKSGNAYAYISYSSFSRRLGHIVLGWMLVDLLRRLTHSSTPELLWKEGCTFYRHLCSRGSPLSFFRTVFQEVTWALRSLLLAESSQRRCNKFFKTYLACILTLSNT